MNTIQYTKPLFVRSRHKDFTWKGRTWSYNDMVPWQEIGVPEDTVKILFDSGVFYHNEELEKQNKVGDRLSELDGPDLKKVVTLLNAIVKDRTTSNAEFDKKKVKTSKIDTKQRGLIRRWLYSNAWATEDFYRIRDDILGE